MSSKAKLLFMPWVPGCVRDWHIHRAGDCKLGCYFCYEDDLSKGEVPEEARNLVSQASIEDCPA